MIPAYIHMCKLVLHVHKQLTGMIFQDTITDGRQGDKSVVWISNANIAPCNCLQDQFECMHCITCIHSVNITAVTRLVNTMYVRHSSMIEELYIYIVHIHTPELIQEGMLDNMPPCTSIPRNDTV